MDNISYCNAWCSNEECNHNVKYAIPLLEKQEQVIFYVSKPIDCTIWKPLENKQE